VGLCCVPAFYAVITLCPTSDVHATAFFAISFQAFMRLIKRKNPFS
jgi:hypothetical protein